jgi:hypothetical protein
VLVMLKRNCLWRASTTETTIKRTSKTRDLNR